MKKWIRPLCLMLALLLGAVLPLSACGKDDPSSDRIDISITVPEFSQAPSSAPEDSTDAQSVSEAPPQEPASSEEPVSTEPPPQPAPEFIESTPAVASISGKTVTVTFKTNVESAVNAIVATSGEGMKVSAFYDYFNRGTAYGPAVSKKATYMVTSSGKTETYELPDLNQPYYLLVNGVENMTGTWQSHVTVITLFDPYALAPYLTAGPARAADSGNNAVFALESNIPTTAYALVTATNATAPTADQVKAAGSGYTGTTNGSTNAATATASPFAAQLVIDRTTFAAGTYRMWIVLQGTHKADAPLSAPVYIDFTI